MNYNFMWEAALLIFVGFILLRLAGRKSIAQMTIAPTVVMISIGNIIVQPIVETSVLKTIIAIAIIVSTLILVEFLQLKFNILETYFSGKAVLVIDNGQIMYDQLRKMRLTIDQLEMQLRLKGIENVSDVKTGTIEPNGQIAFQLFPDAKPVTVGELKKLLGPLIKQNQPTSPDNFTIFDEVKQNSHMNPPPEHLQ